MKTFVAAAIIACTVAPALAGPLRPALDAPRYTCAREPLSRVALTPNPAPCCIGHLNCPQLLSNTGLTKPKPDNRT